MLLTFDLPPDQSVSYYEARMVLVRGLHGTIPEPIFAALVVRKDKVDGDRRNLRFPLNPFLKNASQAITAPTTRGSGA